MHRNAKLTPLGRVEMIHQLEHTACTARAVAAAGFAGWEAGSAIGAVSTGDRTNVSDWLIRQYPFSTVTNAAAGLGLITPVSPRP